MLHLHQLPWRWRCTKHSGTGCSTCGGSEDYYRFLRCDRGLAETTVVNYRRYLRDFLASRGDAVSPAELAALTAEDLLMFSRRRGARLGRTAWNHLATSLSGSTAGWTCRVTRPGIWFAT